VVATTVALRTVWSSRAISPAIEPAPTMPMGRRRAEHRRRAVEGDEALPGARALAGQGATGCHLDGDSEPVDAGELVVRASGEEGDRSQG
jgi:hypothetical protein